MNFFTDDQTIPPTIWKSISYRSQGDLPTTEAWLERDTSGHQLSIVYLGMSQTLGAVEIWVCWPRLGWISSTLWSLFFPPPPISKKNQRKSSVKSTKIILLSSIRRPIEYTSPMNEHEVSWSKYSLILFTYLTSGDEKALTIYGHLA